MLRRELVELARITLIKLYQRHGGIELVNVSDNEVIFLTHLPQYRNKVDNICGYKMSVVNRCEWNGATFTISHHSYKYLIDNKINLYSN